MVKEYKTNKVYFVVPKGYSTGEAFIKDNKNIIDNYTDLSIYDFNDFIYGDKNFVSIRFTFNQPKLKKQELYDFVNSLKNVNKAFYKYYDPYDGNDEIKITYERSI